MSAELQFKLTQPNRNSDYALHCLKRFALLQKILLQAWPLVRPGGQTRATSSIAAGFVTVHSIGKNEKLRLTRDDLGGAAAVFLHTHREPNDIAAILLFCLRYMIEKGHCLQVFNCLPGSTSSVFLQFVIDSRVAGRQRLHWTYSALQEISSYSATVGLKVYRHPLASDMASIEDGFGWSASEIEAAHGLAVFAGSAAHALSCKLAEHQFGLPAWLKETQQQPPVQLGRSLLYILQQTIQHAVNKRRLSIQTQKVLPAAKRQKKD